MDWTSGIQFFQWPELLADHFSTVDSKAAARTQEFAKALFSEAHLFLIVGRSLPSNIEPTTFDLAKRNVEAPLNLPFQSCVFECLSNSSIDISGVYTKGTRSTGPLSEQKNIDITLKFDFIGASETIPGKYLYFGYGCVQKHEKDEPLQPPHIFFASDTDDDKNNINLARAMKMRIMLCLELLNQESTEVGRKMGKPVKLKKKIGDKKEFIKFKPVTIVRPKNTTLSATEEHTIRSVDWSHRWEVRGHWRKIEGLGKNREGHYEVKNFTWVKSHTKGPEASPLIKKTRVVMPVVLKESLTKKEGGS